MKRVTFFFWDTVYRIYGAWLLMTFRCQKWQCAVAGRTDTVWYFPEARQQAVTSSLNRNSGISGYNIIEAGSSPFHTYPSLHSFHTFLFCLSPPPNCLFLPVLYPNRALPFLRSKNSFNPTRASRGELWAPQRGMGWSRSRNRIWCAL